MEYKNWLISEEEKDLDYYRNLILSKLDLEKEGLSQSLNVWNPNSLIQKLNSLGEYSKLPEIKKKSIEAQIKSKTGTISDIITKMSP